MRKKYAVIVAGGSGTRMQNAVPKQFLLLGEKPVLMHTLLKFHEADPAISLILVLPAIHVERWKELCKEYAFSLPHTIIIGGPTRFDSVKNGLMEITGDGFVAVHDAVRPLVSIKLISHLFAFAESHGNAVPVTDVNETIREIEGDDNKPADRTKYKVVQTPQVFPVPVIQKAFDQPYQQSFTDEATVVQHAGGHIFLTEGERTNIKITTPEDLLFASWSLKFKV